MANEKEYSFDEVRQALAVSLKKKIEEHSKHLVDLRKREETALAKKSALPKHKTTGEPPGADGSFALAWSERGKLRKDVMGNAGGGLESGFGGGGGSVSLSENGLGKNAFAGYGPQTPGVHGADGGTPSGGAGGAVTKAEMCKACGQEHAPGQHIAKAADLWNPDEEEPGKVRGSKIEAPKPPKKSPKDIRGTKEGDLRPPLTLVPPPVRKDEMAPAGGCPTCGVTGEHLGRVAGRDHFKCSQCMGDYSVGSSAPTAKSETVEDKAAPGSVLPDDVTSKKVPTPGSGGQVRKGKTAKSESALNSSEQLSKAVSGTAPTLLDMGRPRVAGAVQRPVPNLPGMGRRVAPNLPGLQAPPAQSPVHPETAGALDDIKGARAQGEGQRWAFQQANVGRLRQEIDANRNRAATSPQGTPVPQVNQELKQFRSLASGAQGVKAPGSVAGVGAAASTPAKGAGQSPLGAPSTAFPSAGTFNRAKQAAPASALTPDQQLKADKKAAGVGWLNSIVAKFRGAKFPEAGSGPGPSQMSPNRMAAGRAALARNEAVVVDLKKTLGDCALCGNAEHLGTCRSL